jgi:hypothetical protein
MVQVINGNSACQVNSAMSWAARIREDIQCLREYRVPVKRYAMNACTRHVTPILYCFPCIVWSVVFRIVACPIQCFCNSPGYMCSNNLLTNRSDELISSMFTAVEKEMVYDDMFFNVVYQNVAVRDIILESITSMADACQSIQDLRTKYKLVDYVIPIIRNIAVANEYAEYTEFNTTPYALAAELKKFNERILSTNNSTINTTNTNNTNNNSMTTTNNNSMTTTTETRSTFDAGARADGGYLD